MTDWNKKLNDSNFSHIGTILWTLISTDDFLFFDRPHKLNRIVIHIRYDKGYYR